MKVIARNTGTVTRGHLPDSVRVRLASVLARIPDGEAVEIIIRRWGRRASDPQRAYWWAVVVPAMAEWMGATPEEAHDALLYELWPEGRHDRRWTNGEVRQVRGSWRDLTTDDACELVERAWTFAAVECGLTIPSPREAVAA